MTRVYIATPKSRKIIKDANKRQKEGKPVDWDKVFVEVQKAKAHNIDEAIRAMNAGKKK